MGAAVSQRVLSVSYFVTFFGLLIASLLAGISLWKNRRTGEGFWPCYGPLLLQQAGMFLLLIEPSKNVVLCLCRVAARPEYEAYKLMPLVERALDFVFLPAFAQKQLWRYSVLGFALIASSAFITFRERSKAASETKMPRPEQASA